MSQVIFDTIDPTISGTDLAGVLNDFKDALVSGMSGTSRPTELAPGGSWVDTTDDPNSWALKLWTGVDDVEILTIDLANSLASVSLAVDSFIIRKVSADTVGAILELVKRRIATNGQVLSGDVVGEIRMVGRDDSSNNPVVAKIVFDATENQTSSAFGGNLTFYSTPLGQAALVAHMRFIGGVVETLVPHKVNSQILVGQSIATAATIAQLSADKILVELTGATATSIQGINSGHASKVVNISNRSSAITTLKNQDAGATAVDRLLLPEGRDITMLPQDSVTLYYCSADSRWKLQYASARFTGFTTETFYGVAGSWMAPTTTSRARITAHAKSTIFPEQSPQYFSPIVLDSGKSAYAWGSNFSGQLGVGDLLPRSSPVAVLGGLKFIKIGGQFGAAAIPTGGVAFNGSFGLSENGNAYAWGDNTFGQLGVGDVLVRSSPVAVLGGLKFVTVKNGLGNTFGLTADGSAYAWGLNFLGDLGLGDLVHRSSPVAVLGGLKFREIFPSAWGSCFGITFNNDLYAWGYNANGQLGVGDVNPRSSPVAVLGGLKFVTVKANISGAVIGITTGNDLYAWGFNSSGELGVGNTVPRSSPVAVLGGLKFIQVDSWDASTIALSDSNDIYCWGLNSRGQLGVGDVLPRSSPVAVLGGLKFRKALAGDGSSLGLTLDNSLYAWGFNADGQLGVGDVIPRSSPVAVIGGLSFQDLESMPSQVIGQSWDGFLYAWGVNTFGQLGVGDVVSRSSPVAVLSGLSIKTQDDSDTVNDLVVVGGNTYSIRLGAGPCFFGNKPVGNNIEKLEISYIS